jgi:hypothetical protein
VDLTEAGGAVHKAPKDAPWDPGNTVRHIVPTVQATEVDLAVAGASDHLAVAADRGNSR